MTPLDEVSGNSIASEEGRRESQSLRHWGGGGLEMGF